MDFTFGKLGGVTQIKMSIYNIPNMTGGIDETLVEIAATVPQLIYGLLIFVFGFVLLSGSSAQRNRVGYSDYPLWVLMASISCLMISLILTLTEGLISLEILGLVTGVTILSGLWFFLSRGRGEI